MTLIVHLHVQLMYFAYRKKYPEQRAAVPDKNDQYVIITQRPLPLQPLQELPPQCVPAPGLSCSG